MKGVTRPYLCGSFHYTSHSLVFIFTCLCEEFTVFESEASPAGVGRCTQELQLLWSVFPCVMSWYQVGVYPRLLPSDHDDPVSLRTLMRNKWLLT